MRIIVLIIDSNDLEVYKLLRKEWERYMNIDNSVKSYFVYGDETVHDNIIEENNKLIIKNKDNLKPGIFEKTSKALKYLTEKYPNTDYFIRTNISSFWIWENLLDFLYNKPTTNYISSVVTDSNPAGCGIIMSKDMAQLWANNYDVSYKYKVLDDVCFGYLLYSNSITIQNALRYDIIQYMTVIYNDKERFLQYNTVDKIKNIINEVLEIIPENTYHIRLKLVNENDRELLEPYFLDKLIRYYYKV
jgi:hypothetical protein